MLLGYQLQASNSNYSPTLNYSHVIDYAVGNLKSLALIVRAGSIPALGTMIWGDSLTAVPFFVQVQSLRITIAGLSIIQRVDDDNDLHRQQTGISFPVQFYAQIENLITFKYNYNKNNSYQKDRSWQEACISVDRAFSPYLLFCRVVHVLSTWTTYPPNHGKGPYR